MKRNAIIAIAASIVSTLVIVSEAYAAVITTSREQCKELDGEVVNDGRKNPQPSDMVRCKI